MYCLYFYHTTNKKKITLKIFQRRQNLAEKWKKREKCSSIVTIILWISLPCTINKEKKSIKEYIRVSDVFNNSLE